MVNVGEEGRGKAAQPGGIAVGIKDAWQLGGPVPGNCSIIGSKTLGEAKNDRWSYAGATVVTPKKGDIRELQRGSMWLFLSTCVKVPLTFILLFILDCI